MKEPLDPKEICRNSSSNPYINLQLYMTEYLSDIKMTKFFGMFANISQGLDFDLTTVPVSCEDRILNDIAIVDIIFGSQFATVYEQDVRTTMTGKFSEVGELLELNNNYLLIYYLKLQYWNKLSSCINGITQHACKAVVFIKNKANMIYFDSVLYENTTYQQYKSKMTKLEAN